MPQKVSIDKQVWLWAETTKPEEITEENVLTAYRLNQKKCKAGTCRRNCKANPYCLTGLGEKMWLGEIDDRQWHDIEDPNEERRTPGSFVGLKNLGATCYVNTFLQVWFHNPEVRKAMYMWRECSDSQSEDGKTTADWSPISVCGQLQLMFALLEFSNRRYIDPTSFINCLGLNAAEQQDAQEFSKLFLSVLEDALAHHAHPKVQRLIQEQFCGEYAYVTRCCACGNVSKTPSKFFELDLNIKGNKTVESCIEEFLKVEKMEGDNQYMCEKCNKKQNASREIQLENLPRVLNLQLLRFVFDRKTGYKKKLNSFIQFGEILDVSKYIKQPEGSVLYELSAVLIHRGPSAYSGHYVAHIRDGQSKSWYKFNDEDIEKMEGKKLKLGLEEELPGADGDTQSKKPRVSKGTHTSKNAYMLVYTRQDPATNSEEVPVLSTKDQLSERVKEFIERDNQKFEDYIEELHNMREQNIQNGKLKQEDVRQIYAQLPVTDDSSLEWLSLDWLSKWFNDPSTAPHINHTSLLCSHGRLHPDKVSKLKCVSEIGANQLFDRYSGGPRLKKSSLCWDCVRKRCRDIQNKVHMESDSKFISAALKKNCNSENSFWVGKSSLRSWRRLATEQITSDDRENGTVHDLCGEGQGSGTEALTNDKNGLDGDTMATEDHSKSSDAVKNTTDESGDAKVRQNSEDDSEMKFNEDLLCDFHGNLSPEPGCRRLVPAEVWERLRAHFPTCPEYPNSAAICLQCQSLSQQEQEVKLKNKNLASEQKSAMMNVFLDRNRPSWGQKSVDQMYIIDSNSIEEWRNFIRDPLRCFPAVSLSNSPLLCQHGGLMYQVNLPHLDHRLYPVWPAEWEVMKTHLPCDNEIQVCRDTDSDANEIYSSIPVVCEDCLHGRLKDEDDRRYDYKDAVIYVRKLTTDKFSSIPGRNSPFTAESLKSDKDDPEFMQGQNGTTKRKKPGVENEEAPPKLPHLQENFSRKSNRHRRMRGEKEITISSSQTLKELKVKIMKVFSVAPFDQTLMMDGCPLTEDCATLKTLRVPPGAIIMVKADEAGAESMIIEDIYKVSSTPEAGFKGTGLLSS